MKVKCNLDRNLDIHHVDYNKLNSVPNNLIALCRRCHNKTNKSRTIWIKHFKDMLGIKENAEKGARFTG